MIHSDAWSPKSGSTEKFRYSMLCALISFRGGTAEFHTFGRRMLAHVPSAPIDVEKD